MVDKALFSSSNQEWETPQWLLDILNLQFHFNIDLAASYENARFVPYYTIEDDALSQEWRGTCWCNPPYGRNIGLWTRKAQESARDNHATVVFLIPARTDTLWFWRHTHTAEVRLLPGRLKFELGGKPLWPAPFPSAIVIWRPEDVEGRIFKWNPKG